MQAMLLCSNCGTEIAGPANFCYSCGLALRPASSGSGAPWGLADIAKALAIPVALFVAAGLLAAFGPDPKEDLSNSDLIITYTFGILLEVFLLALVWWFAIRKYRAPLADLGLRAARRGSIWLPFGIVAASFLIFFTYVAALLVAGIELGGDLPKGTFDSASAVVMIAILSIVFAPLCEEIFFRGFIFGGLRLPWSVTSAAVASGLLFGLAHAGNPGSFLVVPPIAAIGILFAWSYAYTDSIFIPMAAHSMFNAVVFFAGLLHV